MFQESRELIVTTPAKVGKYHELAEAMRRGAAQTDKCIGTYEDVYGRTCAWGAAALGMGVDLHDRKQLANFLSPYSAHFFDTVVLMNDTGMSREGIADWLDSL